MASQVSISNRALSLVGSLPITEPHQNDKRARACLRHYEECRDAELYSHPWNFALKRDGLAALTAAPAWGFTKAFGLPSDFLRLLEVNGCNDWKREGNTISASADAPLQILYIARVTDPARFTPAFAELLSHRLALFIVEELTQSNTKAQRLERLYERAREDALRLDGLEDTPDDLIDGGWLESRI